MFFQQIDQLRQSPSGRVVRTELDGREFAAFVANPLPPELTFDAELVRTLSEADRALGELAGLGRTIANPRLLVSPFIRREAVLSSRIEGTQTTLAGLYAYEAGQLSLPGLASPAASDAREVSNYVHALEAGLVQLHEAPIGLFFIRELHRILMEDVRGQERSPGAFRQVQNYVGSPGEGLAGARFVPPPVLDMTDALQAFEQYMQREDVYPPLIRLALIHYQFEAIHPFEDGNGRIGRLLVSLLLVHWGLLPQPLLYLSAFFERRREEYYDLLFSVSARGDWRSWLLFFLRGVVEQTRDATHRAKQLQDLQADLRRRLQRQRTSALSLGVVDLLFEAPVLSIGFVQERFGISHTTAGTALRRLAEEGIVREITGRYHRRLYLAGPIIDIVQ